MSNSSNMDDTTNQSQQGNQQDRGEDNQSSQNQQQNIAQPQEPVNTSGSTQTSTNTQKTDRGQQEVTDPAVKQAKEAAPDPSNILGDDKSFFQDPFIDPNSTAFDQKKKEILKMSIPPHSTTFNEQEFLELVAISISLTFNEKKQIILSIPRLTQYQIDELLKILKDEQKKFKELNEKHLKKLKELEDKKAAGNETLEQKAERLIKEKQDQSQAEDILSEIENL